MYVGRVVSIMKIDYNFKIYFELINILIKR